MRFPDPRRARVVAISLLVLLAASAAFAAEPGNSYHQRNLVSNGGVPAEHVDTDLVNAWGLAASAAGPWWVNAADAGKSLLYNGEGVKNSLVVAVAGAPTGIVFNGGTGFVLPSAGAARFLFASEDGTISAWSPSLVPNTQAVVVIDNSASGASYKGLAIDSTTAGTRLYAANFHGARVDVFDASFAPVTVAGAFTDPSLPAGYAPFGIQTLAGSVFVAYAKQDAAGEDEVAGEGLGVIDKYDLAGRLLARVATGGALNAPWGMALAPAGFGRFSGKLLVGNFGNGRINVFDPVTFEPKGHLKGADGKAIVIDGLWGIAFGNGGTAGPKTTLFFAAGPNDEEDGLFGRLDPP
ncbi:MAG: TIGR03118 family protein [Acidobacteria bacterium]|nr:MAG: TIGR03118 family protein [Acidobacteriota bacterium]